MSDQKSPFEPGGSDEQPLERLLRAALAARAGQVTAQSLRPEAPPARRLRRVRSLLTVALPLVALAAAASIGYLGFQSSPVARHETPAPAASMSVSSSPTAEPSAAGASPSPTVEPSAAGASPSPTDSPPADLSTAASAQSSSSATSTPSPSAASVQLGPVQEFRGVKFRLPTGWTLKSSDDTMACLMTPSPKPSTGWACGPYGVSLTVYSTAYEVHEATYPTAGDLDSSGGFAHQPYCYSWNNPHGSSGTESSAGTSRATVSLAAGQADRTTWNINCASGDSFTGRLWGFRKDQVYVGANGLRADYESGLQAILNSLDFTDHRRPQGSPGDVTATFSGLTANQQLHNDGSQTSFSVTVTNAGSGTYTGVIPDVTGYDVANGSSGGLNGTLQRQDGSSWTTVQLAGTTGRPWLSTPPVSISLAPGQSRTINYRLTLSGQNLLGPVGLLEQTFLGLGADGSLGYFGSTDLGLQLVQ